MERKDLPFKPHIAGLPAFKPPAIPAGLARVIDLSSNENPLGPSPRAIAAVRDAAEGMNRYPDASGAALKGAIARKWNLSPANVALSNGADEWVMLLCFALAEPGVDIVYPSSSFISFWLRTTQVGAQSVRVPLRDYVIDLDATAAAITENTRLVFVCNPNNPTGTMIDAAALDAFLDRVPEHVPVVVDEAYYEYVAPPNGASAMRHLAPGRDNLIVLRSFSKAYGLAGLRVGYMLGSERMIDYLERSRPPFNVNRLAQAAALAALDDDEHVRRSVAANEAAKDFFYRELSDLNLQYIPTQANFLTLNLNRPAGEVSRKLMASGFVTTALEGWGLPNHLRFSFGTPEENTAFAEALSRLFS